MKVMVLIMLIPLLVAVESKFMHPVAVNATDELSVIH